MTQVIRAACAVGFLNIPKAPRTRLANPLCSLTSLSLSNLLIASIGGGASKRPVDERSAVICEVGLVTNLFADTFDGLKHCMKVIVSQQFLLGRISKRPDERRGCLNRREVLPPGA
jgi:hypothetical protein